MINHSQQCGKPRLEIRRSRRVARLRAWCFYDDFGAFGQVWANERKLRWLVRRSVALIVQHKVTHCEE